MRCPPRILIAFLALPSICACAVRRGAALPGEPSLEGYVAKVRQASVMARPATANVSVRTVEMGNSPLAAALAAVRAAPSPQKHLDAAAAYLRAGITDKAHEHFALAASVDHKNAAAYDGLARLWRDWGFPGLALPDAYRAVYFAPRSAEARNTLGTVLQSLGRYPEARRRYKEALALNGAASYALNNLCALDLLEGRPDSAASACAEALSLDPHLAVAQENLQRAVALLALAETESQDARH